jgi:hypothetical protein
MSFTRGTRVSCKPQKAATFSILNIRIVSKATTRPKKESRSPTHALLNRLNIIIANANTTSPSEVPACLSREILDHDAAQDDELGFDAVEDAVVGEVETVGYFDGEPGWELLVSDCFPRFLGIGVGVQKSRCAARVFSVDLWFA